MKTPHPIQEVTLPLTVLCRPGQKVEQEVLVGQCIIKLCQNRVLAKPADTAQVDLGFTLWEHRSETKPSRVRLSLRRDHEYRILTKGKREGFKKVTTSDHFPFPQVRLMVAATTLDYDDISSAIWHLHQFRRCSEPQPSDHNKNPGAVQATIDLLAPEPDNLEDFNDIIFFENWIGTWLARLLKRGHADSLKAWIDAAAEVLAKRTQLIEDPDYIRVQKAVKSATSKGAGVAYKAAVREEFRRSGDTILPDDSVRSILKTLGFDWLPDQSEWESTWLPIAESKGWI